jgi:hypothetical protein
MTHSMSSLWLKNHLSPMIDCVSTPSPKLHFGDCNAENCFPLLGTDKYTLRTSMVPSSIDSKLANKVSCSLSMLSCLSTVNVELFYL